MRDDIQTNGSSIDDGFFADGAPATRLVPIEGGGHSAWFMRDAFLNALNEHVRQLLTFPADS